MPQECLPSGRHWEQHMLCSASVPWPKMRHTHPQALGAELQLPGETQGLPSCSRVSVGAEILFCKEGCSVAVDTGASYITGPAGPISVLMKAIGAAEMAEGEVSKPPLPRSVPLPPCCLYPSPSLPQQTGSALSLHPAVCGGLRPSPSAAQHLFPPGWEGLHAQRLSLRPPGKLHPSVRGGRAALPGLGASAGESNASQGAALLEPPAPSWLP